MTSRVGVRFIAPILLLAASAANAQTLAESSLAGLEFRAIGPAVMGGRIDDVAIVERNPSTIYVGAASGGLWKTINNGTTWQAIFDHETVASIGDVAISPSNPDIVWVGTGEPNNRQSSTFGDGVFKSTDGGRAWTNVGLRETQHIGRIVIDPLDPNTVYVAALGRLWGPNKERGLFKTTDGGATWTNTNFIDEDTGFVDVAMDPSNRHVLYAAAYQRRRTPWGFNGGGPGSGLYKTTDGGRTWKKLMRGLPESKDSKDGPIGRIGIDVSRSAPGVVYALVEHRRGGTFRSDDGGESWQKMSDVNPRPMYYSQIRVDPNSDRRIYVLGSSFFVSTDGGRTFVDPRTGRPGANTSMTPTYDVGVHGDHHALWINPANSNHLVLGGDGGLYFSFDASVTWDKVNNIPLGQFYGIGVDMQKPYFIYGGLQDTHSFGGPSATRHHIGITNADWFQINFGDGMYAQVDPNDPATVYTESQDGNLVRFDRHTGDRRSIKPYPASGEAAYRFNWTSPLVISPHNSKTLYFGGNRVFTSTDRGDTWTAGPDLTKGQDRDKLPIMGVLPSSEMLSRHDGVSSWGTLTALAESPVTAGVLWAGSDDGLVQVSRDGGKTWTNVTDRVPGPAGAGPSGAPRIGERGAAAFAQGFGGPTKLNERSRGAPASESKLGRVSRIEPSRRSAGAAYLALDRHQDGDFAPYVYVTADYGLSWKAITTGLPPVGWVNVVREHPRQERLLFAGTETGLFVSVNGGASWTRFKANFPTVPVDDLVVHPRENDLVVGTHGRSIYVVDDLAPLEGLTAEVTNQSAHLFPPRPATLMQLWKHESYGAQRQFTGPNPPQGAIINYYLREGAMNRAPTENNGGQSVRDEVRIRISDDRGAIVRELAGTAHQGINRLVWDLRSTAPDGVPSARGPFVLPGKYTITLRAAGRTSNASLEVEADPALKVSDADRRARRAFLSRLNELQASIHRANATVTDINSQIAGVMEQLKRAPAVPADIKSSADALAAKTREMQRRLTGAAGGGEGEGGGFGGGLRGRVNGLFGEIDGGGVQQGTLTAPTAVQTRRLEEASAAAQAALAELDQVIATAIPSLNDAMNKHNVPRIAPAKPGRQP